MKVPGVLAVLASVLWCLPGCQTAPSIYGDEVESITYYQHPEHGTVAATDPVYLDMMAECEKRTFNRPVNVDGRLVRDKEELSTIWNGYYVRTMWQILQDEKRMAAALAEAQTGEAEGQQPGAKITREQAEAIFDQMQHPGYYAEIRQLLDRNTQCIKEDSGWRPVRTDYIVIETGRVIKSVDLKAANGGAKR